MTYIHVRKRGGRGADPYRPAVEGLADTRRPRPLRDPTDVPLEAHDAPEGLWPCRGLLPQYWDAWGAPLRGPARSVGTSCAVSGLMLCASQSVRGR
jgi:hypothetical protein